MEVEERGVIEMGIYKVVPINIYVIPSYKLERKGACMKLVPNYVPTRMCER